MDYELQPFGIKVAIIDSGSINTNFRSELATKAANKHSPYYTMTQSINCRINRSDGKTSNTSNRSCQGCYRCNKKNPKPKLRYIVDKDAEEIIEASKKLSEQELFQTISQNRRIS